MIITDPLSLFNVGQKRTPGETISLDVRDGLFIDIAWCPAGNFIMGPTLEIDPATRYSVNLTQGFWLATNPVTEGLWREVMQLERSPYFNMYGESLESPACGMDWFSAREFCKLLTRIFHNKGLLRDAECFDLPSSAQWEYACRAGTTDFWYFGNDEKNLPDHAWFRGNSQRRLHPVQQKLPNPWGLYDLYGNVEELCLDDDGSYGIEDGVTDPLYIRHGKPFSKVARGGYFLSDAQACRSCSTEPAYLEFGAGDVTGIRFTCIPSSWKFPDASN